MITSGTSGPDAMMASIARGTSAGGTHGAREGSVGARGSHGFGSVQKATYCADHRWHQRAPLSLDHRRRVSEPGGQVAFVGLKVLPLGTESPKPRPSPPRPAECSEGCRCMGGCGMREFCCGGLKSCVKGDAPHGERHYCGMCISDCTMAACSQNCSGH